MATPRTNGSAGKPQVGGGLVKRPITKMVSARDSLQNLVSGLGTAKDKRTHSTFILNELPSNELEAAYRGDWVARKIVACPAQDQTREWRAWQAEDDQIELIEAVERDLLIQKKTKRALTLARLFGGSLMILGIGEEDPTQELDPETVQQDSLRYVHVMHRYQVGTGQVIRDPREENYEEFEYYELNTGTEQLRIHPSRVIKFIGEEVPDIIQNNGWGDSCLQAVDDAVKDVGLCSGGIAQLVNELKIDYFKIPGLMQDVSQANYRSLLIERFTLANQMKSIINAMVMDKEEEWNRITTSLVGTADILKVYLLVAAGAADIPATRLLGQSPAGLSATGESDIRNYYDRLASEQKTDLSSNLKKLDEIIIRSALGDRPEEIHYNWRPLWQMTDAEKADISKKKAETYQIDIAAGLIPEKVMAKARVNQLIEDGTYPGLDQLMEDVDLEAELEAMNEMDPNVLAAEETRQRIAANENTDPVEEEAATGTEDAWTYGVKKPKKKKTKKQIKDATPKTLYIRRDVVNKAELLRWARSVGLEQFGAIIKDLHVTIMYSKSPVDWSKAPSDWTSEDGTLTVPPGGMRMLDKLGVGGSVVALLFTAEQLSWRHCSIKEQMGCSWDWEYYQPHITFVYGPDNQPIDFEVLRKIEPYHGEILFGPEIWEEAKTDEEIAAYKEQQ